MQKHHGLNIDFNPLIGQKFTPPEQTKQCPGLEKDMNPHADHGELSYQGGNKLTNKKVLITGGDSGIGRAVAIAFAREGADVAISYYNEHEDARETVNWIEKAGSKAFAISGDIQNPDFCHTLIEATVEGLGGLNILVNNAGFHAESAEFTEISPQQLEKTFKTNIFSFFWTTQNALRYLQAGDCIINTGSVVALEGHNTLIDYACTKAAIHNFTKSLAALLAPKGIRVNCVAPGPVWTPLIASTRWKNRVAEFGKSTLWGRAAQPAEIAPTFVFLASADSRFYSGEIFAPTGYQTTR